MLIVGSLSGIQDFLFDIRESGGKQAAALRFRSLRVQLIAECVARRVLWTLDLPEQDRLIYCTAGKFAIDAAGTTSIDEQISQISSDVNEWLLDQTHGRVRCAIVFDDSTGTAAHRNDIVNSALQRRKLRPWAPSAWGEDSLIIESLFDRKAETDRDAEWGRRLLDTGRQTVELLWQTGANSEESIAGVSMRLTAGEPGPSSNGRSTIALDRLARHVPRNTDRTMVEFVDLAALSRGAPMLGVLKADADALGAAIHRQLADATTFDPLRQFSHRLDAFFGRALGHALGEAGSRWANIYTIFAGGDELLLVGPWDVAIDFASHLRQAFSHEFAADGLTISAGCAIVKSKFPIRNAVHQADELLDQSKAGSKDQFSALGGTWRWADHATIIGAGKQLAEWTDTGEIQRGWLHTLLELALLRRGEGTSRDGKIIPQMATSRLHYHVARNWPKAGSARQWVDKLLKQFEQLDAAQDRHLPEVLRYAVLATRSQGDQP